MTGSLDNHTHNAESGRGRKPTVEEAKAILTLVKGGWLRLELSLDDTPPPTPDARSKAHSLDDCWCGMGHHREDFP